MLIQQRERRAAVKCERGFIPMGLDLDVKQRLAQEIDEFSTGDVFREVGRAIEMPF